MFLTAWLVEIQRFNDEFFVDNIRQSSSHLSLTFSPAIFPLLHFALGLEPVLNPVSTP
jgi:uncharacterized BrkB/YihY/UPF0761 family membrane protein